MSLIRRAAASLAVLGFALVGLSGVAHARENDTFGIEPYPRNIDGIDRGSFAIPLETGETFEDGVRIYNRSDQRLDLVIYAADAEGTLDDTDISAGFRNEEPKGVGSWIDLNRDTIELGSRDAVIVSFRIKVKTSDPEPRYGAIVVENTDSDAGSDARLFLAVRTNPPNTETTSERVRPFLFASPWVIVAILGVVVAAALVLIGWRRSRRSKDVLVPSGEIEQPVLEPEDVGGASRPVIRRLGASEDEVIRARSGDPSLIDDAFLVEVEIEERAAATDSIEDDEDEEDEELEDDDEGVDELEDEDLPPARSARKPAARKARPKAKAKAKPKAKAAAKSVKPKPKPKAKPVAKKKPAKKKPARKAKRRSSPRARSSSPSTRSSAGAGTGWRSCPRTVPGRGRRATHRDNIAFFTSPSVTGARESRSTRGRTSQSAP